MTIKIETARQFLTSSAIQVATEAAAFLALHLDAIGQSIAQKALEALAEENRNRSIQGLPPRLRLTRSHLERALHEVEHGEST